MYHLHVLAFCSINRIRLNCKRNSCFTFICAKFTGNQIFRSDINKISLRLRHEMHSSFWFFEVNIVLKGKGKKIGKCTFYLTVYRHKNNTRLIPNIYYIVIWFSTYCLNNFDNWILSNFDAKYIQQYVRTNKIFAKNYLLSRFLNLIFVCSYRYCCQSK